MVRLHDKICGTFRSEDGATAFATIRSHIQNAALNGHNRLDAVHQLHHRAVVTPQFAGGT